jgi:hypothetical protein
MSTPWRTVAKGLTSLGAGDTLYVRGGTYQERIRSISIQPGTASSPVLVAAYPGERPVIEGLLWITGADHWTFDGINVTWSSFNAPSEHMVKLTDGVGWTFKNAEVWGAKSYAGILVASTIVGEPADWAITGSCVRDTYPTNGTNQDHLIYVNNGLSAGSGLIERNVLFNATNGNGIKLGGPSSSSGGASNVTIRYNTIYNTVQNLLLAWGAHDNEMYRNLMVKVATNYGNIRGYQLDGPGNVAHDNGGGEAKQHILNDSGYVGVVDGGGATFPLDPQFDSVTACTGFHPQAPPAQAFGRYAAESSGGGGTTSAVAFRAASSAANATALTLSIPRPAGVLSGDVMLASVDVRGRPAVTAPTGWTQILRSDNGKVMTKLTYYRLATAAEPTTYTWQFSRAQAASGGIVAYSGVDQGAPVLASSARISAAQSLSITAPSVTLPDGGATLVGFFSIATSSTVTAPAGMTERWDVASTAGKYKVTSEVAEAVQAAAGVTGDRVAASAFAAANVGHLVALNPA